MKVNADLCNSCEYKNGEKCQYGDASYLEDMINCPKACPYVDHKEFVQYRHIWKKEPICRGGVRI